MPLSTRLVVGDQPRLATSSPTTLIVGRKARLQQGDLANLAGVPAATWAAMLDGTDAGDAGSTVSTFAGDRQIALGLLPEPCARHNSPSRAWAIPDLVRKGVGKKDAVVVLALDNAAHARASVLAVARALPQFSAASGEVTARTVTVVPLAPGGAVADVGLQADADAVRFAARLVDMPTSVLNTDAFVAEARAVAGQTGAELTVIAGTDLRDQGFGGLWGVGKAAVHGPALVALVHAPADAKRTIAWVGKGIVYDTGGLSIKTKEGMPGMKGDMGGAAAVLAAFQAAVRRGTADKLVAVLCLAENAVGPDATRPDDILTMKSGKTVEVNNTDAEGRLVLADGVAWACQRHAPDLLVDMATLTGAALVATGKVHAALYCNDEALEQAAVAAGRRVGEPCHPLPYAPELFRAEFKSAVADMKNSVKDRANAQSSCAGQFIANHLPDPAPRWLHVDIAGPAWDSEHRGTGYGVGLLLALGAG